MKPKDTWSFLFLQPVGRLHHCSTSEILGVEFLEGLCQIQMHCKRTDGCSFSNANGMEPRASPMSANYAAFYLLNLPVNTIGSIRYASARAMAFERISGQSSSIDSVCRRSTNSTPRPRATPTSVSDLYCCCSSTRAHSSLLLQLTSTLVRARAASTR